MFNNFRASFYPVLNWVVGVPLEIRKEHDPVIWWGGGKGRVTFLCNWERSMGFHLGWAWEGRFELAASRPYISRALGPLT